MRDHVSSPSYQKYHFDYEFIKFPYNTLSIRSSPTARKRSPENNI